MVLPYLLVKVDDERCAAFSAALFHYIGAARAEQARDEMK
jgi:hypothetical protein